MRYTCLLWLLSLSLIHIYFGLSCAELSAIIDIDEDKEIIFGDELSIDAIVWMGSQPTLREKCERVGVKDIMPSADIVGYLHKCVQKGKAIHYLPPYRPEHKPVSYTHLDVYKRQHIHRVKQ